jgi:SAM-dependent methyltransferase
MADCTNSKTCYLSSRYFPPVRTGEDERECLRLLDDLYTRNRSEQYHHDLAPRPREAFEKDLAWFLCAVPPGAQVLECGSGTGTFALMLAESGCEVTAVDMYSPGDLAKIREMYSSVANLSFAHVNDVAECENKFDAAISICVLEHILFPDEVLLQWGKALKPGGVLSIICPNYSGLFSPLRLAVKMLKSKNRWRYACPGAALGHALENLRLNLRLKFSGEPGFVRCFPHSDGGGIVMSDSDMDAVHLPCALGIKNFLNANGFEVFSCGQGGGGAANRLWSKILPTQLPSVRIHARKKIVAG